MSDRDPLDVLAELSRSRRRVGFGAGPDPDAVLARLSAQNTRGSGRHRRRRWWRGLVASLATTTLIASGAAAWALLQRERPTSPTIVQCLQRPDLTGSQAVIPADGTDPLSQCMRIWERNAESWGPPPPLVGCVSPEGHSVVVPGDESTCGSMGLVLLDPTITDDDQALIELREALTTELGTNRCVPPNEAEQIAVEMLADTVLDGWSVVVDGDFTEVMPCGMADFDAERRTISINPFTDFFTTTTQGEPTDD